MNYLRSKRSKGAMSSGPPFGTSNSDEIETKIGAATSSKQDTGMPDQHLLTLARRWILEAILKIFDAELADGCYGLADGAGAPVSLPPRLSPVARSDARTDHPALLGVKPTSDGSNAWHS